MNNTLNIQLSPDALQLLRVKAKENKRSPEQEARRLLEDLFCPAGRLRVGSALAGLSKASGIQNNDIEALEEVRATNPSPPMWFG